jgi:putative membrane protein
MFLYIKALHIIFVVTWFAALFYMPRLFIYNTEAQEKTGEAKDALTQQFSKMMKGLWLGIAAPSAVLTLVLGLTTMIVAGWDKILLHKEGRWLLVKLIFVLLLYVYHFSLHKIFKQELRGVFRYSSQQLRIWNEVATIFLVAIVMLATVKQSMSFVWGLAGLVCFIVLLMSAIKIYKIVREKKG